MAASSSAAVITRGLSLSQHSLLAVSSSKLSHNQLKFPSAVPVKSESLSFSSRIKLENDGSRKDQRSSFVQTAAVRHIVGSLSKAEGLRFAVVVGRFNEIVTRPMLEGALSTFKSYSVREEDIDVVWIAGCYDIPVVAERLGRSGKYHAILCLGAVIRGESTHYDAVVNSAASGVLSAGLKTGVPCVFGILTCDNLDQALNRAGGKVGNKGSDGALTAIELASLFEYDLKF